MKSLTGELTENEKWSIKGNLMGECWYKDCCVSDRPDKNKCGNPVIRDGNEKMKELFQSETINRIISTI